MKNIVFITSRFPYPLNKGDKLRAYNQLKGLSKYANVHLISLSEKEPESEHFESVKPYCASINNLVLSKKKRLISTMLGIFSVCPFSVLYFFNSELKKKVKLLIKEIKPDHIHCHLIRTSKYVSDLKTIPKSIDFMDCFSLGATRELNSIKNPFRKLFLKLEYWRLVKFEQEAFINFNKHFVISESDRNGFQFADSQTIHITPNGVDFNIFYPKETVKEFDLVFSGHMGYIPNISAAKYIIKELVPKLPSLSRLLIAGIGVTPEISTLQNKKVIIQEHFTHIRDAFHKSRILVAPMNISIGLQNKIIQAMAMKIPVVCSPQANSSIKAMNRHSIIEADTPEKYIDAINLLLNDKELYQNLASNAYDFVQKNFNWHSINSQFADIILD